MSKLAKNEGDKSNMVAIVTAVIGLIGTIMVAYFSFKSISSPTELSIRATQTAEARQVTGMPISTSATPASSTSPPIEISQPDVPAAGEDWVEDCIQSKQWKIYPALSVSMDEGGCYQQPVWDSMYTRDKGFFIFAEPKALISAKEYGLFTQLPQRGNVGVSLNLDVVDNGQVWFGIFSAPDIHSTNGVFLVAPPGDTKSHAFALKYLSSNNTVKDVLVSKVYNNASGVYQLGFNLQYGSITASVENTPLTPIPFASATRWLFVGYRAKLDVPNGNVDIQALFSNLVIK